MQEKLIGLITSTDRQWDRRWKWNCMLFIISYIFMGAVTGITNDSYVSYLNLTVPDVVKGLPMYVSISTFIIAILLLLVHQLGYKRIIISAPIIAVFSLLACIYSTNGYVILVANILVNIGVALFDFLYPMMFTAYVPKEHRVAMFARVMYCNLISQAMLTFLNGKIVVWKFAQSLGISYDNASQLSENASLLNAQELSAYVGSYQYVLWIAVILTIGATIFLFFLKEQIEDYQETAEEMASRQSTKKFDWAILANKYVIMWVVIFSMIRFGALLVIPYFPIYLNNFLHIPRGVVSTIITLQTLAMVLGFFATPWLERKLGSIIAIATTIIACAPLMLLMANGAVLGSNVAWIVGGALFLRSGLANAGGPIQQSLPLTFVTKNLIPAYSSLMLVVNSLVGIIAGIYARYSLLVSESGYGFAYYITAGFYVMAMVLLLLIFTKKYNRALTKDNVPVKVEAQELAD